MKDQNAWEKGHQHDSDKRPKTGKTLNFQLLRFAIREKRLYFFDIEVNEVCLTEGPGVKVCGLLEPSSGQGFCWQGCLPTALFMAWGLRASGSVPGHHVTAIARAWLALKPRALDLRSDGKALRWEAMMPLRRAFAWAWGVPQKVESYTKTPLELARDSTIPKQSDADNPTAR